MERRRTRWNKRADDDPWMNGFVANLNSFVRKERPFGSTDMTFGLPRWPFVSPPIYPLSYVRVCHARSLLESWLSRDRRTISSPRLLILWCVTQLLGCSSKSRWGYRGSPVYSTEKISIHPYDREGPWATPAKVLHKASHDTQHGLADGNVDLLCKDRIVYMRRSQTLLQIGLNKR